MLFIKKYIYKLLHESSVVSIIITLLILSSIAIFAIETEYPNVSIFRVLTLCIAVIFGIEYLLRIWVANLGSKSKKSARMAYIFSFSGIIDLIAFLPVLILPQASGSVVLRALRLLRLAQLMKSKPLAKGLRRTMRAINESRVELAISIVVSLSLIFIGAVVMYFVEGTIQPDSFGSVPRALWWSIATLTTVGYGDVYPITAAGKIVASVMSLVGIGAVALPAGILAAAFSNATERTKN